MPLEEQKKDPGEGSGVKACLLLVLLCFVSALSSVLFKLTALSGEETSIIYSCVNSIVAVPAFLCWGERSRSEFSKYHFWAVVNDVCVRGVALWLFYQCLALISPPDVAAVFNCSSLISSIVLEAIHLKAKPRLVTCLAALLGTLGMVCISQPGGFFQCIDLGYIKGVLLGLGSGILAALYFINLRRLPGVSNTWHLLPYSWSCLLFTLPQFVTSGGLFSSCENNTRIIALSAALLGSYGAFLAIKGYQLTRVPSIAFIIRLLTLVISFALQLILLPQPVTLNSCLGSGLIVFGVLLQFYDMRKR